MAMRPDPNSKPLEWYDFLNPLNYFGANDFYGRLQGGLTQPVVNMGEALQQSLTTVPQAATKAAEIATTATQTGLNTKPIEQQPIQSANFGTYTNDAFGSLQKLGMFSPPKDNNNAANMAQFDRQMGDNRNMLAGLMTRENPFSANNSGYLASQAQIVGQQGRGLLNVLRDQRAKNALNGVTQDSGIAQNAERAMRTQSALQANGALTGLETDRYAKAANWDDANRQFQAQAIQALNSGDLNRFNALTQANQQNYDNARQQPFDALRYADGVRSFEQAGRMDPLDVRYRQGMLSGQDAQNEGQRLQNVRYGYGNQFAQSTLYPSISAANAGYNRQSTEDRLGNEELQYWGQDGNRNYTRGMQHFNRGFKPIADFTDAFAKPAGKFLGAAFGTNGG